MAATIIHVGRDMCHRLPVLESAGYKVETCTSIIELGRALNAMPQLDAVLISEGIRGANPETVSMVRSRSSAPVILFRESQLSFSESAFDLVVPVLVPPQTWLAEIAAVIARCRSLRAETQGLGKKSALKRESRLARAKSSAERRRARQSYGKKISPAEGLISGPDTDN